jgi:hypothetical protein
VNPGAYVGTGAKPGLEEARAAVLGLKYGWKLRSLSRRPLPKRAVVRQERANAGSPNVCHIVGSGWSLAESAGSIDPADYVVGYNLAALLGRRFDAYHMERIDERAPGVNEYYRAMIAASGQDRVYIKNLHDDRVLPRVIEYHLSYGCMPYRTLNAGGYFSKGEEAALCRYLLDGGGGFLLQYRSTLMLLIVLYAAAGFRQIVLHGQDLSGPYFFDVARFALAEEMRPRERGILPAKPSPVSEIHAIDRPFRSEPRIVEVLPAMVDVLDARGVSLTCATANSPISRYCPVYAPGAPGPAEPGS